MIGIIDYGMGNLHSVCNALKKLNMPYCVSKDLQVLKACDGLILPGVGAFKEAMENLNRSHLVEMILEETRQGKPLLGICLGMQILFEKGYEVEMCEGLSLLKGEVVRMQDANVKIPHMGWNSLEIKQKEDLTLSLNKQAFVYYVHSYYAQNYEETDLIAYSLYGDLKIPGYVRKKNIFGMQYHPEKSGKDGLKMLEAFCNLCLNKRGV